MVLVTATGMPFFFLFPPSSPPSLQFLALTVGHLRLLRRRREKVVRGLRKQRRRHFVRRHSGYTHREKKTHKKRGYDSLGIRGRFTTHRRGRFFVPVGT